MELKNSVYLEVEKEERRYRMEMPVGAPLGEAYEVSGMFMDKMVEMINEHAKKMHPQEVVDDEDAQKNEE